MSQNNRALGGEKELMAARYLVSKGYEILEMNFRNRRGEIDIIAKDSEYLVFIEVKYRKNASAGYPAEAVNEKKQRTISLVADYYMLRYGIASGTPCRFDVIAILGDEITHYENAFEYQGGW